MAQQNYTNFPLKSLSGSDMRSMAQDNTNAMHALEQALEKVVACSPHPRDYPGDDAKYQAAREEHLKSVMALQQMIDFHQAKAIHCFDRI